MTQGDERSSPGRAERLLEEVASQQRRLIDAYYGRWFEDLQASPRAREPKRITAHGFKIFSQSDEDGIIQEIFRRIGTADKRFIEFGVEDGTESNTRLLLMLGWTGLWLDGSAENVRRMDQRAEGASTAALFITAENIDGVLGEWAGGTPDAPAEVDLLSIDIDRNDYWVWQAVRSVNPRVVIIEYNAAYPPPIEFVVPYHPQLTWDGSNYFGASLASMAKLGSEKGYGLVGCNLAGVNAFFVRTELLSSFHEPYTAEEHYEPARYELGLALRNGHPPRFGVNEAASAEVRTRL
jgi:hypothetical protein